MPTAITVVATVIAWVVAAGIIVIGAIGLRTPQIAAGFGIPGTPVTEPSFRAWLAVKAVRDIGAGVFVIIALLAAPTHFRGWMAVVGSLIALGDALIVKLSGGPAKAYVGVHGLTAAFMFAAGVVLSLS